MWNASARNKRAPLRSDTEHPMGRFYFDVSAYHTWYNDFIGYP